MIDNVSYSKMYLFSLSFSSDVSETFIERLHHFNVVKTEERSTCSSPFLDNIKLKVLSNWNALLVRDRPKILTSDRPQCFDNVGRTSHQNLEKVAMVFVRQFFLSRVLFIKSSLAHCWNQLCFHAHTLVGLLYTVS